MSLYQNKILKKYIATESEKIKAAYKMYSNYFHNSDIQENIRNSKEEQFQEGFLRELFVKVLGYTLNPDPNYNLITEKKKRNQLSKSRWCYSCKWRSKSDYWVKRFENHWP